ncbi:MAG: tripartite tricarboxylate transporter TctB family protein [Syntrophales bacterium]
MKKGLIVSCVLLIILSLYGIIESSRLERTMQMGIGIAFVPLTMSLAIGGLSIAFLVNILRGRVEITNKPIFQPDGGRNRIFFVFLFLVSYVFLIEVVGYVPSTFLYLAATIVFLRRERIFSAVLMSAGLTFFLYAIFRLWLKSPLPTGFLGI